MTTRQRVFHQLALHLQSGELSVAAVRVALEAMTAPLQRGHVNITVLPRRESTGLRMDLFETVDAAGVRWSQLRERRPVLMGGVIGGVPFVVLPF